MAFTPAQRMSAPDPAVQKLGHTTSSIVLADEAEYDLGGVALGVYETSFLQDERPRRVRWNVAAKADVVFTAAAKSTTVLTLTVASGAGEGIETGQWLYVNPTATTADALVLRGWFIVADTTATTIVLTHGTSGTINDVGAGVAKSRARVYPEASQSIVLWDSIQIADNQDANLGKLERGLYTVEFLDTIAKAGIIFSDGTVMTEYMEDNSTDEENTSVVAATSNTVTALFVSSGDVILRNGADIAAKVRVTYTPHLHSGLDQDGTLAFYAKGSAQSARFDAGSLRLKNRLGGSRTLTISRVG